MQKEVAFLLSTKQLEPEAGDMLKNREIVFEKAEEMAEKYRQKLLAEAEGITLEEAAIVDEASVADEVAAVEEVVAEDQEEEAVPETQSEETVEETVAEDQPEEMVGAATEE